MWGQVFNFTYVLLITYTFLTPTTPKHTVKTNDYTSHHKES